LDNVQATILLRQASSLPLSGFGLYYQAGYFDRQNKDALEPKRRLWVVYRLVEHRPVVRHNSESLGGETLWGCPHRPQPGSSEAPDPWPVVTPPPVSPS